MSSLVAGFRPTVANPNADSNAVSNPLLNLGYSYAHPYPANVTLNNGQLVIDLPVLRTSGIGSAGSFAASITHYSNSGQSSVLGPNWMHRYDVRLVELEEGRIALKEGFATQIFEFDDDIDQYVAVVGENTTMAYLAQLTTPDACFCLFGKDGTRTKFSLLTPATPTSGRPFEIVDRYGNGQTLVWEDLGGQAVLTSVTDSYGRKINYTYNGVGSAARLTNITDSTARKSCFQYDSAGRLVGITGPQITRAADGNQFLDGLARVFAYDVNNRRTDQRNNLIAMWAPNQATPFIKAGTCSIDIDRVTGAVCTDPCGSSTLVKGSPAPVLRVQYGQDPLDTDNYNKVVGKTDGDPAEGVGGTTTFSYKTIPPLEPPFNIIDEGDPIKLQATVVDPNGNHMIYDLNSKGMVSCFTVVATPQKNSLQAEEFVTWTKFNEENQPVKIVYPEGNTDEFEYESGVVTGIPGNYTRRRGLPIRKTRLYNNDIGIDFRDPGNNGQKQQRTSYFHEPVAGQVCGTIDPRGNPIDDDDNFFPPQNGGTTPTLLDRSRYATIDQYDFQKNTLAWVSEEDESLQIRLFGTAGPTQEGYIASLIDHVDTQMIAGGIPAGFEMDLGDINGDGTGNGNGSGLDPADDYASRVRRIDPFVTAPVPYGSIWRITSPLTDDTAMHLWTNTKRGQVTTYTDPEGNVAVTLRYPFSNPEGNGALLSSVANQQQYGLPSQSHVDAPHFQVRSLVGPTGDMVDFNLSTYPRNIRTNTIDEFLNLITRYESGGPGGGCSTCAYDAQGNPLAVTDPNGYTTRYERNELGRVFRQISPLPYEFKIETHYDANGNVTRIDKEDKVVQLASTDPKSPDFGKFTPTGSAGAANVPVVAATGGAIRPGWFTDLFEFDSLNRMTMKSVDATGSVPAELVTHYEYDANSNLIKETKPEGNLVEYDYDERNLRIATRVGYDPANSFDGAVTINAYDKNGNLMQVSGPAKRGGTDTSLPVTIKDAFGSGVELPHDGDYVLENIYDGLDQITESIDAVGGRTKYDYDPGNRVIKETKRGTFGGPTPENREDSENVDLSIVLTRYEEAGRVYEQQQQVFIAEDTPLKRAITVLGGGLAANSTTNGHTNSTTLTDSAMSDFIGNGPHEGVDPAYILTRSVHDLSGRLTLVASDNTARTSYAYDGANRQIESIDPLGNTVESNYDRNGNLVYTRSTEVCTITTPAVANEAFEKVMKYDALNRMIVLSEPGADGQISEKLTSTVTRFTISGYDSRGNQTISIDPKGNTTLAVFDGAGRQISTVKHMRDDGQGIEGPVDGQSFLPDGGASIVTSVILDSNGRIVRLIDDNNGETAYQYDSMDRQTMVIFADSSSREYEYNLASDVTLFTDQNGSMFTNTFDPLGRKVLTEIDFEAPVTGTTEQNFQYDGLSRLTLAGDSVEEDTVECTFVYDSLNRTVEESQTFETQTRTSTNTRWDSLTPIEFTYPDGSTSENDYDLLYRRIALEGPTGTIAQWKFFGPSRVAEVRLGCGLTQTMMNNARTHSAVQYPGISLPAWGDVSSDRLGYDGAGRMICKRYVASALNGSNGYADPTSIAGYTTAYDASNNKLFERCLQEYMGDPLAEPPVPPQPRSHLYQPFASDGSVAPGGYDSANRLREYQRGLLYDGTTGQVPAGGGIEVPITLPFTNKRKTYDLDGLGNWKNTVSTAINSSVTIQQRQHNYLNEIMRTQNTGSGAVDFEYDLNGNMRNDGEHEYQYDALNRIVKVDDDLGEYVYDALNRRVWRHATVGVGVEVTQQYAYFGWRCVEDSNEGTATAKYYWGIYLDELLSKIVNDDVYFILSNLLYTSVATVKRTGTDPSFSYEIKEAYDTDAYGNTLIFINAGAEGWFSNEVTPNLAPVYCDYIFTGQRFDAETENYYYKNRYYVPALGRFNNQNPWGIVQRRINRYDYVWMRPTVAMEPTSLAIFAPIIVWGAGVGIGGGEVVLAVNGGVLLGAAGVGVANGVAPAVPIRAGQDWADPFAEERRQEAIERGRAEARARAEEEAAAEARRKGHEGENTSKSCNERHSGWPPCPTDATSSPNTAVENHANAVYGALGLSAHVQSCWVHGPARNCGASGGNFYFCDVKLWGQLATYNIQYSISMCNCCWLYSEGSYPFNPHPSGGAKGVGGEPGNQVINPVGRGG